jgi:inosose dehydratase
VVKFGISTYSLLDAIEAGEMTVLDVIEWIAEQGGEHVEIVPFGFQLVDNEELIDQIREKAKEVGIEISNYAILADLLKEDETEYEAEIQRVISEVDIANRLGVKLMRHDVSAFRRPFDRNGIDSFEAELPRMVHACRRIADYAVQYGITTTVENHGFYVNGSDRIQRLITQVNRPNYKQTIDVGNYWCMDEDPVVGVKKNIGNAAMIHLKDFYYRSAKRFPGSGTMFKCDSGTWFRTITGNLLRGAIAGDGDVDLWEVLRVIKESGYDGYISLEFEGLEDGRIGAGMGLKNAKYIWEHV